MLHGWGFDHRIWDNLAARLAHQYRVYQVDLPGHGRSLGWPSPWELHALAQALATRLPGPALWLGWSLGGLLAQAVARYYPAQVRALALVATTPRFVQSHDWPQALAPSVLDGFVARLEADRAGTLQRFVSLQVSGSPSARAQLRHVRQHLAEAPAPQPGALAAGLALLKHGDMRHELAQIRCPAWLCLGARDTLVPVGVLADWQRLWPHAQAPLHTLCLSDAAHMPFLSHVDAFDHSLQSFLDDYF